MPRIHLVSNLPGASALGDHLRAVGLGPTSARSADALLVLIDRPLDHVEQELLDRARHSVPVLLAGPTIRSLPPDSPLVEASGLLPGTSTPRYELQPVAGPDGARVATRLGDFRPVDSWVVPDKVADDVQRLLVVRHQLAEHPICTWRPSSGLGMFTLGASSATLEDPAYHRLVGRWLRHALGELDTPSVRVGLLGQAEAVTGHHAAIDATEGLDVAATCDGRSHASRSDRGIRRIEDATELIADPDLALVVVATQTHARPEWARRALQAGKHVVVDAPIGLTTTEADELARVASARSLVLAVHSERRYDPSFQALRRAVRAGSIGDVLWVQTHQGSFSRPAGTWHDDARASGGLGFDRGYAHVDWLLDLVDTPVEWVSATSHKRVWHHVSNADQMRILLHFADGAEAQVTISDLMTAPVPRFHLLGSAGEIFGNGTEEEADVRRAGRHAARPAEWGSDGSRAGTHRAAEWPGGSNDLAGVLGCVGRLTLVTHDGARTRLPVRPPTAARFYYELADCLTSGWPAPAHLEQARAVLAVVEAASSSAAAGGTPVAPSVPPNPPATAILPPVPPTASH